MQFSVLSIITLVSAAAAQSWGSPQVLYGGQCDWQGLQDCTAKGAFGCAQNPNEPTLAGANCVVQTNHCDGVCQSGYAYQKFNRNEINPDNACICTGWLDASQPSGGWGN